MQTVQTVQTLVNREDYKPGARKLAFLFIASCCIFAAGEVSGQDFKAEVAPLVKAACLKCHDGDTKTRLDFEQLGYDLSDPAKLVVTIGEHKLKKIRKQITIALKTS